MDPVKGLKHRYKWLLQSHYSHLEDTLSGDREAFASRMYQADLIGRESKRSQEYSRIIDEFLAGMNLKSTLPEVQEHYEKFIGVLEELGGAAAIAANLLQERQSTQPQFKEHDSCLNYLLERVERSADLANIAFSLKWAFISLVDDVQISLKRHNVDLNQEKRRIKIVLTSDLRGLPATMAHKLDYIQDFDSLLSFLTDHRFIGYLNYILLKKLAESANDQSVNDQFAKYEEKYVKLLSTGSFAEIMSVFKEHSHLSPSAPVGLPHVVFRLEKPWLIKRVYNWITTSLNIFSTDWSEAALLEELRENCILITYAILPSALSTILRDLTDPVILEQLKTNGATVVSLPEEVADPTTTAIAEPTAAALTGSITDIIKTSSRKPVPKHDTRLSETRLNAENVQLVKSPSLDNPVPYNRQQDTVLLAAVRSHNVAEVISLLQQGADPNCADPVSSWTPLHIAAARGDTDIGKVLLDHEANLNIEDKFGRTPIFQTNKPETVDILIAHGARTDVTDKYGQTLLHIAAADINRADLIQLFIAQLKVDVNAVDKYGNTALHLSVKSDMGKELSVFELERSVTEILLSHGANPNIVNKERKTPRDIALTYRSHYDPDIERKRQPIVSLLERYSKTLQGRDPLQHISSIGRGNEPRTSSITLKDIPKLPRLEDRPQLTLSIDESKRTEQYSTASKGGMTEKIPSTRYLSPVSTVPKVKISGEYPLTGKIPSTRYLSPLSTVPEVKISGEYPLTGKIPSTRYHSPLSTVPEVKTSSDHSLTGKIPSTGYHLPVSTVPKVMKTSSDHPLAEKMRSSPRYHSLVSTVPEVKYSSDYPLTERSSSIEKSEEPTELL